MSSAEPILGVDYGRRRCGLALSDVDWTLATPLPTLERGRREQRQMPRVFREHLVSLRSKSPFQAIVFGWPEMSSAASRELGEEILRVADSLRELWSVDIAYWDEAFTSVEATRRLAEAPRRVRRDKGRTDQLAAQILLQEFLDAGAPFAAHAAPPTQLGCE